jgi:hypothetical protein
MTILEICHWMQDTSFGTSIRESVWTFPLIEGTHLLCITISVGTLLIMDLRMAGWLLRDEPVSRVTRAVLPVSLFGYCVMFLTGIVLFWCQAVKAWSSVYFKAKLIFLLLAGINALVFEMTTRKSQPAWDDDPVPPARARFAAIAGMILWAGVICAGRTMAYNF